MKTIVSEFKKYEGTKEYNGIVATIQNWYYSSLVRDAWCATSTSYFAKQAGILDQLGGKNEGVYEMYLATKKANQKTHIGLFWDYPTMPSTIKENDVIFLLRNGRSHVCHAVRDAKYSPNGYLDCIGGNQSDMICTKPQAMNGIQAIYRPVYGEIPTAPAGRETVKQGRTGESVVECQRVLNLLGYRGMDGLSLSIDGDCGRNTTYAIETFQFDHSMAPWNLEVDGSCGPKTWAAIDDANKFDFYRMEATTDVYIRKGPGTDHDRMGVLVEDAIGIVSQEHAGWVRIIGKNGWVSKKYLKTV